MDQGEYMRRLAECIRADERERWAKVLEDEAKDLRQSIEDCHEHHYAGAVLEDLAARMRKGE